MCLRLIAWDYQELKFPKKKKKKTPKTMKQTIATKQGWVSCVLPSLVSNLLIETIHPGTVIALGGTFAENQILYALYKIKKCPLGYSWSFPCVFSIPFPIKLVKDEWMMMMIPYLFLDSLFFMMDGIVSISHVGSKAESKWNLSKNDVWGGGASLMYHIDI